MTKFLEFAELTDVGLRRANNQDSLASMRAGNESDFFRRGDLFVVADGMGRHAAGELASKIAVDTIPLEYFKNPNASPPSALKQALEEANRRIHARGMQNPDFRGMGTTTCALAVLPQGAIVGHVGDSRVYRLRGNTFEQLTFDHSVVWELRAAAKVGGVEVPGNIPKNYITRSLGHDPSVQVDLEGPFPLVIGDTFLLCSDGLSGQVEDDELGMLLVSLPPDEVCRVLVDLANLRGGPDNITVIVVRVSATTPTPPSAKSQSGGEIGAGWWAGLAATLVLAAILFLVGQTVAGAAAGVVALVLGLVIFAQMTSKKSTDAGWTRARLGRGPHMSIDCAPNDAFVAKLAALLYQLQTSTAQQNWTVDQARLEELMRTASASRNAGHFQEAVREYCHAITFLMGEIRKQRRLAPQNALDDDA